jgi:hypothetical protein
MVPERNPPEGLRPWKAEITMSYSSDDLTEKTSSKDKFFAE